MTNPSRFYRGQQVLIAGIAPTLIVGYVERLDDGRGITQWLVAISAEEYAKHARRFEQTPPAGGYSVWCSEYMLTPVDEGPLVPPRDIAIAFLIGWLAAVPAILAFHAVFA